MCGAPSELCSGGAHRFHESAGVYPSMDKRLKKFATIFVANFLGWYEWRYMVDGSLKNLSDYTVGLLGFGNIGQSVARLLKAFGLSGKE